MVRYELGKEYEFEFVGKDLHQDSDGTHYFRVRDDESQYLIRAFDYQWDYDAIPNVFVCKVISTSPFIIEQAKSFLLRERYPIPKESVFSVYSVLTDNKSQSKYYLLKDAFGLFHRYYPKNDKGYKIGDSIKLWVGGVKQEAGGGAHLELSSCAVSQDKGSVSPIGSTYSLQKSNDILHHYSNDYYPILICSEGEGQNVEFKSCLSIPAGALIPDIDKQSEIIVKVIAGFLNADGGTLYIGLDDNGYLREGIGIDFPYLSKSKALNYVYKENDDSYIRFITDRVRHWLGTTAQSYVHAQINCERSRKYCVIKIDRCPIPVWYKKSVIYERMGQNISQHFDFDITFFILKRFGLADALAKLVSNGSESTALNNENKALDVNEYSSVLEKELKDNDFESIPAIEATFGALEEEKRFSYGSIFFLEGGKFVISDRRNQMNKFIYKAELPQNVRQMQSYDFVICYDNGDTDIVDLSQALFNNKGVIVDAKERCKGWNSSKVIKNAFCVRNNRRNSDIIAYVYSCNGTSYLKCCELSCLAKNPHKQFGNEGNQVLPDHSRLLYAMRMSSSKAEVRQLLGAKGLLFESPNDRNRFGVPISEISGTFRLSLKNILAGVVDVASNECLSPEHDSQVVEANDSDIVEFNTETQLQKLSQYNELYVLTNEACWKLLPYKYEMLCSRLENLPLTYDSIMTLLAESYPVLGSAENTYFICRERCRHDYFGTESIHRVFRLIIEKQRQFLNHPVTTTPLCINKGAIAHELNIVDSSISRITQNFAIICKTGVFNEHDIFCTSEIKDNSGDYIHPDKLADVLRELREKYPKMTDGELAEKVKHRLNTSIARRTIVKYRDKYKIPNSRGKISGSLSASSVREDDTRTTDFIKEIAIDPEVDHRNNSNNLNRPLKRGTASSMIVRFPDGTIFAEKTAAATLLRFVQKVGVENVRKVVEEHNLKFSGVPVISNHRDWKYGVTQKDIGGGWLLITHCSNKMKKNFIDKVSEVLNLGVTTTLKNSD